MGTEGRGKKEWVTDGREARRQRKWNTEGGEQREWGTEERRDRGMGDRGGGEGRESWGQRGVDGDLAC